MTDLAVYMGNMPRFPEEDRENFVAFGGINSEMKYDDGTESGGIILIPRYIWQLMDAPESLVSAFSDKEFTPIEVDFTVEAER